MPSQIRNAMPAKVNAPNSSSSIYSSLNGGEGSSIPSSQ
jgi:hypothetical protein